MEFLNVWTSKPGKLQYYGLGGPIFVMGDYAIYQQWAQSYIYTYKDIAIANLAGKNIELVEALYNRERPENAPQCFLYDRALETIDRAEALREASKG